jgi:hypothetical protein
MWQRATSHESPRVFETMGNGALGGAKGWAAAARAMVADYDGVLRQMLIRAVRGWTWACRGRVKCFDVTSVMTRGDSSAMEKP